MRMGRGRGGRCGLAAALLPVLALAACTGPNLPNSIGGPGGTAQTPTSTMTFDLSLTAPVGGVPTHYAISAPVVEMRDKTSLHASVDPGLDPRAGPGPHAAISWAIPGYGGPNTYRVVGILSYVQFNSGAGHSWHAGAHSVCTFTVNSDGAAPRDPHQDPRDQTVPREVKGAFSCQALQPNASGDPDASVTNGTFDTLYHDVSH